MTSKRVSPVFGRALFGGGAAVVTALLVHLACGERTSDGGSTGGGAGSAGGGATGGFGGAGTTGGGAGGASGSGGTPVYDGGLWQPTGDPEWTKVPWVDCGAAYAKHPEQAVPPLVWQPCEGNVPGCERLRFNWQYEEGVSPMQVQRNGGVFKTPAGLVLVMAVGTSYGAQVLQMLAAFADAKTPIAAWKGPSGCIPVLMEWSATHVCQAFGSPLRVGLVPLGPDLHTAPLKSFESAPDLPVACNATKLVAMDLANDYYVRDLQTDALHEIGWSTGVPFDPRVHEEIALVQRWHSDALNNPIVEGWIWTPPNSLTLLVDASPELVYDIRTDGQTLVWLQATASAEFEWVPADIWVSPYATSPAGLQPKKLRQHPRASIGLTSARIGAGLYAAIQPEKGGPNSSSVDHRLHIYRLTDGRHWELPRFVDIAPGAAPGTLTVPVEVLALDAEEVWYSTRSQTTGAGPWTIVRQRLAVLGPGD